MIIRSIVAVFVICSISLGSVQAELSLGGLRGKFESALTTEESAYDVKMRELREGYVGALERLKRTFGREEKFEAATQVLSEIEAVEGVESGGAMVDLPERADYRLKGLRGKLNNALRKCEEERRRSVAELAGKYFKVLDQRKRSLTRAGKIREALVVDEELKRVGELPEVKLVMNPPKPEGDFDVEAEDARLDLYLTGRKYTYEMEETEEDLRTLEFDRKGEAAFSGYAKLALNWRVEEGNKVILSSSGWSQEIVLVFSKDGKTYKGETAKTKKWRRGSQIEKK